MLPSYIPTIITFVVTDVDFVVTNVPTNITSVVNPEFSSNSLHPEIRNQDRILQNRKIDKKVQLAVQNGKKTKLNCVFTADVYQIIAFLLKAILY